MALVLSGSEAPCALQTKCLSLSHLLVQLQFVLLAHCTYT